MQTQTPLAWPFPITMSAHPLTTPIPYQFEANLPPSTPYPGYYEVIGQSGPELDTSSIPTAQLMGVYLEAINLVKMEAALSGYRKDLMTAATENGIGIVHIFEAGEKGGLTIAYKKSTSFTSGRMVQVAVATCSIEDHFNKKIGVRVALEKFFDGETIELPLLKDYCLYHLNFAVKAAFTALYRAI